MKKPAFLERHFRAIKSELFWWMFGLWLLQMAVAVGLYLQN